MPFVWRRKLAVTFCCLLMVFARIDSQLLEQCQAQWQLPSADDHCRLLGPDEDDEMLLISAAKAGWRDFQEHLNNDSLLIRVIQKHSFMSSPAPSKALFIFPWLCRPELGSLLRC
jgi:hypothetical protein